MIDTIIQGDCLEVMKEIPDKSVDFVLTDPPYGIKADKGVGGFGLSDTYRHYEDNWDNERPRKEVFDEILRVGKKAIIFGGQFFANLLPVNGCWIVWDKVGGIKFQNPFSDCELAWTNLPFNRVKKYTVIQQGFIAQEKQRFHPTQKPIELFMYLIQEYSDKNSIILDPFLGSGTTAVAAKKLGRHYIGIEIEPKYVEIAKKRLNFEMLDFGEK